MKPLAAKGKDKRETTKDSSNLIKLLRHQHLTQPPIFFSEWICPVWAFFLPWGFSYYNFVHELEELWIANLFLNATTLEPRHRILGVRGHWDLWQGPIAVSCLWPVDVIVSGQTGVWIMGVMLLLSWELDCGNWSLVIAFVRKGEAAEVQGASRGVGL